MYVSTVRSSHSHTVLIFSFPSAGTRLAIGHGLLDQSAPSTLALVMCKEFNLLRLMLEYNVAIHVVGYAHE